jgi:hypothetical protein
LALSGSWQIGKKDGQTERGNNSAIISTMVVEAQQAGSTTNVGRKIALQGSKFLNFFFFGGGDFSLYLFGDYFVLFFQRIRLGIKFCVL